jgi:hypothetical protein
MTHHFSITGADIVTPSMHGMSQASGATSGRSRCSSIFSVGGSSSDSIILTKELPWTFCDSLTHKSPHTCPPRTVRQWLFHSHCESSFSTCHDSTRECLTFEWPNVQISPWSFCSMWL